MSITYLNPAGQGGVDMVIRQEQISDLTAEIEKSIRAAQRLKLDMVVYLLMMAQLEISTLSVHE